MQRDTVNHPPHYNSHPSGVECIDIAEHLGFNLGNAFKYVWRAGLKHAYNPCEDIAKALWYVRREQLKRINRGPAGVTVIPNDVMALLDRVTGSHVAATSESAIADTVLRSIVEVAARVTPIDKLDGQLIGLAQLYGCEASNVAR